MNNIKLTIELVPQTCWYSNVRSEVTTTQWNKIRKKSYEDANHRCEICGDSGKNQGRKHDVECHEVWKYDDLLKEQTLIKMIALCPQCHQTKHAGLANVNGKTEQVIRHLIKVNKMSRNEAIWYFEESFRIWMNRSQYKWTLDISALESYIGK